MCMQDTFCDHHHWVVYSLFRIKCKFSAKGERKTFDSRFNYKLLNIKSHKLVGVLNNKTKQSKEHNFPFLYDPLNLFLLKQMKEQETYMFLEIFNESTQLIASITISRSVAQPHLLWWHHQHLSVKSGPYLGPKVLAKYVTCKMTICIPVAHHVLCWIRKGILLF